MEGSLQTGFALMEKEEKMNDNLISRKAAIEALNEYFATIGRLKMEGLTKKEKAISLDTVGVIKTLPFTQPETSRIENALHGKSAEEQYDFLRWLMQDYGMQFTDTRVTVIEWLRGEDGSEIKSTTISTDNPLTDFKPVKYPEHNGEVFIGEAESGAFGDRVYLICPGWEKKE